MLGLKLENHFAELGPDFYTAMPAERVGAPRLLHANPKAAPLIGLDAKAFSDPDFTAIFSGHKPLDGFSPLAMAYSGHQFGVWAGQLGDGRALLIGQARNDADELWDIQLKGAGKTPYSRFGDGRAVMRSTIREYLAGEAMAALGIPTSRSLCIIATGEAVMRETPEPGAILARLARSHIRFGHFEHFHYAGKHDHVRRLADYVIGEYFPQFAGDHAGWFGDVVRRTAHLIAHWQAVGFAHGVMNTDNMSILGLTLDYGPFGFMDSYEPGLICNHTDEAGRYAFDMQPAIAHWNLRALAAALNSLIPTEALISQLDTYESHFRKSYRSLMRVKCGLVDEKPGDDELIGQLLTLIAKTGADYTSVFRALGETDAVFATLFTGHEVDAMVWAARYRARLPQLSGLDAVNPRYVLRNWVAEAAIRAVEDRNDASVLDRVLRLVQAPYDAHADDAAFAAPPAPEYRELSVSCSS